MIANKKEYFSGVGMLAGFVAVLAVIFAPVFKGHNGLEYLDSLYNSISKGSAYYIPQMREAGKAFNGNTVDVKMDMHSAAAAAESARLFEAAGALANISGTTLHVSGELGKILANSLEDANAMYHNDAAGMSSKYDLNGRQVLYNWWQAYKLMEKELKAQSKFNEAKIVDQTVKKAIECAYNYYGIESKKITDSLGVVIFSLFFYVIYTLWYGFAVMFMFEGWGMKLEH